MRKRTCQYIISGNVLEVITSKGNVIVGHLGVRITKDGKFNVRIVADGIEHHIGNYDTLELAIEARNAAEDTYHGEFASHRGGEAV